MLLFFYNMVFTGIQEVSLHGGFAPLYESFHSIQFAFEVFDLQLNRRFM